MTIRPLKFKLDAYRAYAYEGLTPIESFVVASEKNNNVVLSGCMTNKNYASGYMSDDIKNFLRKKIIQNNQEVLGYFLLWGLDTNF